MLSSLTTLAVIAVLAVAARWLIGRARSRVSWDERCAACGYVVWGLPEPVCPECGSDLRRVGAVLPQGVAPGLSIGWLLLLWTAAVGVAYAVVYVTWLKEAGRAILVVEAERRYLHPNSERYDGFDVRYHGRAYRGSTLEGSLELTLHLRGGGDARLMTDAVTGAYRTVGGPADVQGASGSGRDVLARWLGRCGVDPTDMRVAAEVDEMAEVVRSAVRGVDPPMRTFWQGSSMTGAFHAPTRGARVAEGVFWVVWLGVTVWLWRRKMWPPTAG